MTKLFTQLRALVVVTLACIGSASANAETLYLRTASNPDVAIELGSIKQIAFEDQTITIELTDGNAVECPISDFTSIRTDVSGTPGQTAVQNIVATSDEQWIVYDIKGNLIGTADQLTNANSTLSSRLAHGVYILKSQSKTLKLIVR